MSTIRAFLENFRKEGRKGLAILVDPDNLGSESYCDALVTQFSNGACDLVLVGGSLIHGTDYASRVSWLRKQVKVPLVLFPGSPLQIHPEVDAILFLSLISGRNPEFLIGQHVVAAPRIRELSIETIATGYMLIDGGRATTASYISGTSPIPADKSGIAASTALAGEMLGLHCIYLDAGSGASAPISSDLIKAVRTATAIPIIAGGGIVTSKQAESALTAGADIVVVGSLFEKQPERIAEFASFLRGVS